MSYDKRYEIPLLPIDELIAVQAHGAIREGIQ